METYIIIMVICLIGSAYFSATETAFSCANKTRLRALAEKGNKRAELASKLADKYDRLISTILIGNNIVNILLASMGTLLFVEVFKNTSWADKAAAVSTLVITVAVLIFGEITPKSIANDFPEKFAMFSAPFIRLLIWILMPINLIFSLWKNIISLILKVEEDDNLAQEELLMMVEEAEQEGDIDTDEGDLLRNAIEFSDLKAEDILTHRVDLEALPIDSKKSEIAQTFTRTRFSRIPIYEDNIDNIVGVIHQKDFYVGSGVTTDAIKDIISPVLFVHQSEMADDLLKKLQKEKSHIAVVVDEYGGTLGIVTMEDILEQLVGDIWDEHDEVVEEFKELDENNFVIDCNMNLDDFCEEFDIEVESDSVSVGGWVAEQIGNIPDVNDTFTFENLVVTVTEVDSHRAATIKVEKQDMSEEEQQEEKD
ncbi:MAG: HlyC/CorC family transporter [Clostridia bacterium]|nr:HlyC/CorC family transporter [Clostridia bacterium]